MFSAAKWQFPCHDGEKIGHWPLEIIVNKKISTN
jgi:hypothetical protein